MKPVEEMSAEEAREQVSKFRRLLNPVWMQLVYAALGERERPKENAAIFTHSGGGSSDWTTFGELYALMGDPWEAVKEVASPNPDGER